MRAPGERGVRRAMFPLVRVRRTGRRTCPPAGSGAGRLPTSGTGTVRGAPRTAFCSRTCPWRIACFRQSFVTVCCRKSDGASADTAGRRCGFPAPCPPPPRPGTAPYDGCAAPPAPGRRGGSRGRRGPGTGRGRPPRPRRPISPGDYRRTAARPHTACTRPHAAIGTTSSGEPCGTSPRPRRRGCGGGAPGRRGRTRPRRRHRRPGRRGSPSPRCGCGSRRRSWAAR